MDTKQNSITMFKDISFAVVQQFKHLLKEEKYTAGQTVFSEGDPGDALFIVKKGEIIINKLIDKKTNSYKTLASLGPGDFFGEIALIDSGPRTASAIAKAEVELYRISRESFNGLLKTDPTSAISLLLSLLQTVSSRLRQTDKELVTVYETGKIIGSAENLKSMCEQILNRVMESVEGEEGGLIAVWNEFNDEFDVVAEYGIETSFINNGIPILKTEPMIRAVIENQERLIVNDLVDDDRFKTDEKRLYYGASILICPFVAMEKVSGLIILFNRTKASAFTKDQINMVSGITAQVAATINNMKHREEDSARQRLEQSRSRFY